MTQFHPIRSAILAALICQAGLTEAASHSDAPMMVLDPSANITDVYSFVGLNSAKVKVLNILVAVNPLEDPGNGVIFDKFAEDVRYSIHIAKGKATGTSVAFDGKAAMSYHFRFNTTYKNRDTILSYGLGTAAGPIQTTGDAQQNFLQRFVVERSTGGAATPIASGLNVPPVNVGPRTTPNYYDAEGNRKQGAVGVNELPSYVKENIHKIPGGITVFAGQREDGFYADTPGIFDFLGVRSPGKDGFSGYNVHVIAMQIPVSQLVKSGDAPILGVYATTERRQVQVRGQVLGPQSFGPWVQVSRMGNPLFNETLVALRDKDRYNMTSPTLDAATFSKYAKKSELAFLLNAVLGTSIQVDNRTDLVGIFIPDLLRVDTSTNPVRLAGQGGFNRLSFLGGDTLASPFTGGQVPSGWPNGRRLGDDVVDIALTAIASGPAYTTITPVGDNVNANDTVYDLVFPYAGTPWGGPGTTLH